MITFFCSKKDAAADGANFRQVIWNALVAEMALYHEMGAPKTVKACKAKYSRVCTALQTPQISMINKFPLALHCLQHCHNSEKIVWF
jgi:hypothetical protein